MLNFEAVQPSTPADQTAANTYGAIMNRLFLQPLTKGTYPDAAMTGLGPHMPDNWQQDMELISSPLDWLGVNYYTGKTVATDSSDWPSVRFVETDRSKTQMGWDIHPEGLHQILTWITKDYTQDLPIFITENGMAWDDHVTDDTVEDPERTAYIAAHLQQAQKVIAEGCNIQGYFYWSLLDNYEWAFGYEKRFGMIHVDFKTQKRTPKASYYALKQAFERNK